MADVVLTFSSFWIPEHVDRVRPCLVCGDLILKDGWKFATYCHQTMSFKELNTWLCDNCGKIAAKVYLK